MSISTYKKKRKFAQTPEPDSGKKRPGSALRFVIQRHDARNLHYDLRLEMEGVLKSWAVPKGPSMVAGEKRLAIMVEDHPLDYKDFFGIIPEGNYGAGTMDIWDEGTYSTYEEEEDPEKVLLAQLKKGDLKFALKGKQLRGKFALVRMKNTENQWLLLKKDDEFALKDFDVEKVKPLKLSPRLQPKEKKDQQRAAKPEKTTERKFPEGAPKPMLAKLSQKIIDHPRWIYEVKYDGYRMISTIDRGRVGLWSRNGNSFNSKYDVLARELKEIRDQVILDGEVVIENKKGISDFQLLQNYNTNRHGELKYYVFDMLYLNGEDITGLPLMQRKELLDIFFKKYQFQNVFLTEYQIGEGAEYFKKLASMGYEGVIAKGPEGTYLPGRRAESWLKVKANLMQEAVICGYTLPQKGRKYFGSLILGVFEGKDLKYIGNVGTGFNDASLKELHGKLEKMKAVGSPFDPEPNMGYAKGKAVWVRPKLVCNVKFSEWSQEGRLRHPVFMGLRTDKSPEEVVREDLAAEVSKKDMPAEMTITIGRRKVKCTNLNKVYWPEDGYTKGDLINYYLGISKYMLPYLKNRPQSLNRHPNGIHGKSFYQKNMDLGQLPSWVETARIDSKSRRSHIDYLICNDAATLIFMANLGCIEINPWHSTIQQPEKPTYMMLDLDPGDISFVEVVNTALVVKEICDEIKIPCYCKTSGATGLHIHIPLGDQYNYGQVKTFAEILAVMTHHRLPDVTSVERSTSKRKDLIYVDFLQNRRGQTLAAPYSVRPRPGANVSAPLNWEEVNHELHPQMFTIKNMLQRLEKVGDLWSPVLKEGINLGKTIRAMEKLS